MNDTDTALNDAVMRVAQAKVAEALGGDILGKMVEKVMTHRSSYQRDRTEFEVLVEAELYGAVRKAVGHYLQEHSGAIKGAVAAAMASHGVDKFASTIIDAFAEEDWRAQLNVTIARPERDD